VLAWRLSGMASRAPKVDHALVTMHGSLRVISMVLIFNVF